MFTWQSGTPISELGAANFDPRWFVNLVERGSYDRTPSIWDLNFRIAYHLDRHASAALPLRGSRLLVDVFHAFGQRKVVAVEQRHFWGRDDTTGEPTLENPNFLRPIAYQPPMTVRVRIEVSF